MALKDYPAQAGRVGYVILSDENLLSGYTMVRDCPFCTEETRVQIPAQGLWDWEHGAFVQMAMPSLSPDEREMVMTGTHAACWDAAMGPED